MTAAIIGKGTVFAVADPVTPTTFVPLAELTSLTPPSSSVDIIDVTNMDSADRTREFIAGMIDPGECSMGMNFIPGSTTDAFIQAWRAAGTVRGCKITWPNGVIWQFEAFVSSYDVDAPFDDKLSATLALKVVSSTTVTD